MAMVSNVFMFQLIISSNFAFLFVDPEKQTNAELINSTREMMLALSLLSVVVAIAVIFFFQKNSSSLMVKTKETAKKGRSDSEVSQLTTEVRSLRSSKSSIKDFAAGEDDLTQQRIDEVCIEEEVEKLGKVDEGLTYPQQLLGVLKDPTFVLMSVSSVLMSGASDIYTNNLNAMAATYGFPEVKNYQKIEKN